MASSHRSSSRYTRIAEAALMALVVLCPLALGGVARWLPWPMGVLAGVAAVFAVVGARRQGQSIRLPLLAAPLAGGAVLCALQLVPLPSGVLRVLSPEAAALREFALEPLGLTGARPVSLDPSATWRELARHLAYLLAFLATVQVCRARDSRMRLLSAVVFTGAGVAVVGLGHALLGVSSLFGLRPWVHARPPLVTFFGNPNHLAGYLGLAATVGVGLALTARPRARAMPHALAAAVCGMGVVLSLSRGGIAFFVFGQVLLALWLGSRRRESPRRATPVWARSAVALLGLLAVLAVGAYVAADALWAEARTASDMESLRRSKVSLWPMMAEAARAFPVLGMGRGAFEAAFPRYQAEANPNTFTHPENAVLQLATELGVPGLLLLAVSLWGFARLVRREHLDTVELAALAGVAALALHNLFDFSLELPACAVTVLVVLGAVARPRERERRRQGGLAPSVPLLATAGVLTGVGLLALGPGQHRVTDAEASLAALITSGAPVEAVREQGLALIDRHPSDYLLYRLVASAEAARGREGAADALAFVNRALYLAPWDAVSHRVAAHALLALNRREQGFLEYRLAQEAGDAGVLQAEAVRRARTVEELVSLTSDTPEAADRLFASLADVPARHPLALAYGAWAREHFEGRPGVAALWAREARLRMGRKEFPEAEAACARVEQLAPDTRDTVLLRAELLRARGEAVAALQAVERLVSRHPGDVELGFTLAGWQLDAGLVRRARDTLQQLGPFLSDYRQRARLLSMEAASLEREGLLSRAVERQQTAARLVPTPEAHFAVARLQEALRRYDAASRSVHEGLRLLPPEAREAARAWAARLEAAERERVDQRRQELADDPDAQELQHLLGEPKGSPVEP
ncbi:O-antigen ligase family protein [Myxococcus sp. K15C18031901]|uniref:O-antigen ligase family protein n=1 Tax=Myxococcus dinghuensis TaxID=2906761 RepID=UPI0020A6E1BF|nr:O-antigen ligase family protein [Myxococcus dinghuensis]MCP3104738.1 O-antigen ligase family protein [Myxococcus dinghuensis]